MRVPTRLKQVHPYGGNLITNNGLNIKYMYFYDQKNTREKGLVDELSPQFQGRLLVSRTRRESYIS